MYHYKTLLKSALVNNRRKEYVKCQTPWSGAQITNMNLTIFTLNSVQTYTSCMSIELQT